MFNVNNTLLGKMIHTVVNPQLRHNNFSANTSVTNSKIIGSVIGLCPIIDIVEANNSNIIFNTNYLNDFDDKISMISNLLMFNKNQALATARNVFKVRNIALAVKNGVPLSHQSFLVKCPFDILNYALCKTIFSEKLWMIDDLSDNVNEDSKLVNAKLQIKIIPFLHDYVFNALYKKDSVTLLLQDNSKVTSIAHEAVNELSKAATLKKLELVITFPDNFWGTLYNCLTSALYLYWEIINTIANPYQNSSNSIDVLAPLFFHIKEGLVEEKTGKNYGCFGSDMFWFNKILEAPADCDFSKLVNYHMVNLNNG